MNEKFTVEIEAKKMSDDLVDKLVAYRRQLNMTQQDVADVTGIKRANIARIEGKKFYVSWESLLKYAECLNLDVCVELRERQE